MGIYFIAAGNTSDNRTFTLDRSWSVSEFRQYLSKQDFERLRQEFPDGIGVHLWGANAVAKHGLDRVRNNEYVVDFKNQEVPNIFQFSFLVRLNDTQLQQHVGWDSGKTSTQKPRPYNFVFFLKNPRAPRARNKQYFLDAFDKAPHFYDSQKYQGELEIDAALNRTNSKSVEELLGLDLSTPALVLPQFSPTKPSPSGQSVAAQRPDAPTWLKPAITAVKLLWDQKNTLERDHENVVAKLFEAMGHQVKFQRSHIDILIEDEGRPLIVVEVKQDRSLSRRSIQAIEQAYRYAQANGAPKVVVTNGNYYLIFDRTLGLSYEANLMGELRLLELSEEAICLLNKLKK